MSSLCRRVLPPATARRFLVTLEAPLPVPSTLRPQQRSASSKSQRSMGSMISNQSQQEFQPWTSLDLPSEASWGERAETADLTEAWEYATRLLWDNEAYVTGLAKFLKERDCHKIIDVSGGWGFPAIHLARMGFDVTYNDLDDGMVRMAKERAAAAGVADKIKFYQVDWLELDQHLAENQFDCLLCRGNSIGYVDSWTDSSASGFQQMASGDKVSKVGAAVAQFARIVKPGGLCYIDKSKHEADGSVVIKQNGKVDGRHVDVDWTFTNHLKAGVREWDYNLTVDEKPFKFKLYSVPLTGNVLTSKMTEAGLLDARKVEVEGEVTYNVYVSTKPAVMLNTRTNQETEEYYDNQKNIYLDVWDPNGRICWGFYENEKTTFAEAGTAHVVRMAEKAGINERSVVLDIGCGTGLNCEWLARAFGCHAVGIDISKEMVEECNKRAAAHSDLKLSFIYGTVDERMEELKQLKITHVWSNGTIYQIHRAERLKLWKQLAELLPAGGKVVFDDATCPNGHVQNVRSKECFYDRLHVEPLQSPEEYRHTLKEAGFAIEVDEDISSHQRRSYEDLSRSARAHGHDKLADDYSKSCEAIQAGDVGWHLFVAQLPGK